MAGLQDSLIFVKREQLVGFVNRYIKKDQAELPFITKKKYPSLTKLSFLRTPIHLTNREIVDLKPAPLIGQQTRKYLEKYVDEIEDKKHILDYPEEKPLLEWLWSFIVWGIYAIRSGNF